MAFNIDIRVSPGQAKQTIAEVGAQLDAVETKGKRAGEVASKGLTDTERAAARAKERMGELHAQLQAMSSPLVQNFSRLGEALAKQQELTRRTTEVHERLTAQANPLAQGFGRLGEALNRQAQAAARATEVHDRLRAANAPLAQSFAGLAGALQREQAVLERIRGPAREHQQQVQALESLYHRGAITAKEYQGELSRVNQAARGTRGAFGGLSESVSQLTSMRMDGILSGLGGMKFALLGAAGAAVGLLSSITDIRLGLLQAGDEFIKLKNRISTIAPTQLGQGLLLEDTRGIADRAMTDWRTTNELYVRLTNSTRDLGLAQSQVAHLTETISKGMQLQGASAQEASAGMLQLSQAFASGRLQGDEFRSLSESMPFILDLIAQQMGVTRGELKKLGSEGAITAEVMVKAFEQGADQIGLQFDRLDKTVEQKMKKLQNAALANPAEALHPIDPTGYYGVKDFLTGDPTLTGRRDIMRVADPLSFDSMFGDMLDTAAEKHKQQLAEAALLTKQIETQTSATASAFGKLLGAQEQADDAWKVQTATFANMGEVLRHSLEEADRISDPNLAARATLAWNDFGQKLIDIAGNVRAFGVSTSNVFDIELPSSLEASIKALLVFRRTVDDQLGQIAIGARGGAQAIAQRAGGVVTDVASLLGLDDPWMSPEDRRAQINKQPSRGYARRQQAPTFNNIWDPGMLSPAGMFGPDMIGGIKDAAAYVRAYADDMERIAQLNRDAEANSPWRDPSLFERVSAAIGDVANRMRDAQVEVSPFDTALAALERQATDVSGAMTGLFTHAFSNVENSLVQLVTTGKASFGSLVDGILADLTRLATRELFMELIGLFKKKQSPTLDIGAIAGGSDFGGTVVNALGAMFGGGHAMGGTWTAPITGGPPDSIPVMFRVSSGERVSFDNGGGGTASGGAGAPARVTVVNQYDRRALLAEIDSPEGEQRIINVIRRNPGAIKGMLR